MTEVDLVANRCQQILVSRFTCTLQGNRILVYLMDESHKISLITYFVKFGKYVSSFLIIFTENCQYKISTKN